MPSIPNRVAELPLRTPVVLQGLTSESGQALNGRVGFITPTLADQPGRVGVKIFETRQASGQNTREISVKPENILDMVNNDGTFQNIEPQSARKLTRFMVIQAMLASSLQKAGDQLSHSASFEEVILAGTRDLTTNNRSEVLDDLIRTGSGIMLNALEHPEANHPLALQAQNLALAYLPMTPRSSDLN